MKNIFSRTSFGFYLLAVILVVAPVFFALFYITSFGNLDESLLQFDAALYQKIKQNGYNDHWLTAFFPAFPFLWRILGAGITQISIINSVIFIISIALLSWRYQLGWLNLLLVCTVPSLIFMFVPYTESLFFACGAIILVGLRGNKFPLVCFGLFLSGLVRPTAFVFVAAVFLSYVITESSLKKGLLKSLVGSISALAGLFATFTIHHHFTRKWAVFFESQKIWENYLHVPSLPFTSWGGDLIARYDGLALFIGLVSGVVLVYLIIQCLVKKTICCSADEIFSLAYFSGTTILILAYRDGNLYSLNRFLFATPFFLCLFQFFDNNYKFHLKHVYIIFFITEVFWLLFASFNHIANFLQYSMATIVLVILLFTKHRINFVATASKFSLIAINILLLFIFLKRYLNGEWVG